MGEHQQKNFHHTQHILAIRWGGGGDEGKFGTKVLFQFNVEWSSKKLWKMIAANVRAIVCKTTEK